MHELYGFELEPEVRDWPDGLSDSDYKRVAPPPSTQTSASPPDTSPAACGLVVIPGYTQSMKTAISVPDEIFSQVGSRAAELGISRSEFFTRAATQYLGQLADASLTRQIDAAISAAGDDDSGRAAAAAGRAFLAATDDEW
jgi:hypothetical protein